MENDSLIRSTIAYVHERLKDAKLEAGQPKGPYLFDGDEETLYDFKSPLPKKIEVVGFSFDKDENAYLNLFLGKGWHETDSLLEKDEEKVNKIIWGINLGRIAKEYAPESEIIQEPLEKVIKMVETGKPPAKKKQRGKYQKSEPTKKENGLSGKELEGYVRSLLRENDKLTFGEVLGRYRSEHRSPSVSSRKEALRKEVFKYFKCYAGVKDAKNEGVLGFLRRLKNGN